MNYASYKELQEAFKDQKIHPADLKEASEIYINRLLDPIRQNFSKSNPKLQTLVSKAYPPPQKQGNFTKIVKLVDKSEPCFN